MTQILTNNVNNSIILTLNNVQSPDSNVISLDAGESILYDSVAVTDILDPNYNVNLIQEYIDAGVLLNETLGAAHESELELLSQANLTINLSTGIPEVKNVVTALTDNLQVLPVVDQAGNVLCVYYKSIQGMLISTDFGATQTLINNDNLLFPDEITSFAVQVYESFNGTLRIVKRLFIGTLREGVKTFTPGVDLTYVDFEPDAVVGVSSDGALFKNTTIIHIITKDESDNQYVANDPRLDPETRKNANGVYYPISPQVVQTFTTFCPTFVLALVNSPNNCGCPLFIASRSIHTDITHTTVINSITGAITESDSTPIIIYDTKVVLKYLHSNIYRNNVLTDTILSSQFPTTDTYNTFIANNRWLVLQENSSVQSHTDILTCGDFPEHILDTITEYTPFGAVVILKQPISEGGVSNRLFRIACSKDISAIPVIDEIDLTGIQDGKLKNISYLNEAGAGTYSFFITTDRTVWRYSSVVGSWEQFIFVDNPISYLSTTLQNGVLSVSGFGSLNDLSNFILVPKDSSSVKYIGLLGTELGLISYDLILKDNLFVADVKYGRTLLNNVTKVSTTDIKVALTSKGIYAFVCSYAKQIPIVYYNNTSCSYLNNYRSDLTKTVSYLKHDVETTSDYPYYVNNDTLYINSVPSDEQLSYDPVLIDNTAIYDIISPTYTFKLNTLQTDTILVEALSSILGYKYYFPTITERVISSANKAERNILQLDEFNHYFKMNFINGISTTIDTGTALIVSKQSNVILPIFVDNGFTRTSIVCIRFDGKVILPVDITQILVKQDSTTYLNDQYQTTLTFSEPFTGTIFTKPEEGATTKNVSGFFTLINHGLEKYPQVQLDSSLMSVLNDIKYVDLNRLEISFKSPVDGTITLVATATSGG